MTQIKQFNSPIAFQFQVETARFKLNLSISTKVATLLLVGVKVLTWAVHSAQLIHGIF